MKLAHRSPKSKEKFADGLMSVANAIHAAALIGVLVFPLTAFITAVFSGGNIYSPSSILTKLSWNDIALFGAVYLLPIAVGQYAKEQAMQLYDEVNKAAGV